MDWIHCNICYSQPGEDGKQYLLTSCGHIYCTICYKENCLDGVCKKCKSKCNEIKLTHQMKPDVQMYFTEPIDMIKRQIKTLLECLYAADKGCKKLQKAADESLGIICKGFGDLSAAIDKLIKQQQADFMKLQKVSDFQRGHRATFTQMNKEKSTNFNKLMTQYKMKCMEIDELKKENAKLKELLQQYRTQIETIKARFSPNNSNLSPRSLSPMNTPTVTSGRVTLRRRSPDESNSPAYGDQMQIANSGIEELSLRGSTNVTSPTFPHSSTFLSPPQSYSNSPTPQEEFVSPPQRQQYREYSHMPQSPITFTPGRGR